MLTVGSKKKSNEETLQMDNCRYKIYKCFGKKQQKKKQVMTREHEILTFMMVFQILQVIRKYF